MLSKTFGRVFFVGTAVLLLGMSLVGCDEPSDGGSYQVHSTADLQVPKVTPVVLQEVSEPDPRDWTYWRGPEFTGTSFLESDLIGDWDPRGGEGSNVSWKRDDLGGRSTPIVMNGRLYLMCRVDPESATEGERVVCLDAVSGETIWENRFNVWLSDVPDTRVGWSSVVGDPATGRVYALGVCGYFQCMDGETGKTLWSVSMHERFGLLSTYGGRTNFPIVCDDVVIISAIVIGWGEMAKPAHRFVAFDKMTGEVVW
ncbi:MAG: PQQ-binding-like beta-propeller repeat protein, partial [Pirellulaceae bacterium]